MQDSPRPRPMAPPLRPLPVLVLADVSGSMTEGGKMDVLNRSIATMIRSFAAENTDRARVHVGVITFGGEVARLHHPLVPAGQAIWQDMRASGRTPLGAALDLVTDLLGDRAIVPEHALTPALILVSDGIPTDDWQRPLKRLLASRRGSKAVRLAVGVGQEMDDEALGVLNAFIANPELRPVKADEVDRLSQFFARVTMSVTRHTHNPQPGAFIDPAELDDLLG